MIFHHPSPIDFVFYLQ